MSDESGGGGIGATASPSASGASPASPSPSSVSVAAPAVQGTQIEGSSTDSTPADTRSTHVDRERFDGVNTRMQAAEKQLNEWRQKHGWAESVDPRDYQQIQSWSQSYRQDPVRWFVDTVSDLKATYPHLSPALQSEAARILSGARGQQRQAEPDIEPDIPVMDEQGRVVSQAFSADRAKQLIARELKAALQPLVEEREQRQQAASQRQIRGQAEQAASSIYQRAQTWHGYKEHEPAIAQVFEANPDFSLQDAYLHVLHSQILPSLDRTSQARVLSDLQQKATATTVNPASPTGAQKPKFKGFGSAAAYYDAHPDEAAAMANR